MAITINSQPTGTLPVYNDLIYVVASDKTAQANFKYIADYYINGSVTKSFRESKPGDPVYGVAVFNPARVIENYLSGNFDLDLTAVTRCTESILTLEVKFGEEYGLSSSGTTVYANLATSTTIPCYNGVFDWESWIDEKALSFVTYRSQSSSSMFLSNSPAFKKVYTNEKEYVYAINRTSGDIYYFNVNTYDSAGAPLGSYRIDNPYQARSLYYDRMVRCPAGWNLNDISYTTLSGSAPILKSTVSYYEIYCTNYAGTITIGLKRYTPDTSCERFTKYRLHFLNKLGGYDSFSFTKKSKFNSDIKRENFKANLGVLASASTFTQSKSQRAVTQYATNINDKVSVTSDWITSGDVAWLEELVTSPDVYVEKNGSAIPIIITASSYDRQNGEDKKIFNLSIEFEYSYKRYRQRF
jgi:hypothetical protein